ncbi:MAG: lipoprotein insertase outer membrane protein LolB [Halieaceae bacterium]|nr:lipoprotein insertase outer membrane protein LolB [Halieaceae bacterium]
MRSVLTGLLTMLLSACAQQPMVSVSVDPTSWSMETKIAFSGAQESGSGYARFDYAPGLLSAELSGAFGLGKSRIDCNLSYCDISGKNGENRLWLDQGNLELQDDLLLPVNLLPEWLLGNNIDDTQTLGWTLDVSAWQEQRGVRLPQKISLTHTSGNTLKIFVIRWIAQT